jgi:thioredoxin
MPNLPVATDRTFASEVLDAANAVVDFWGEGCPACGWLEPVVEKLGQAYAGQVKVVSADVGEAGETAASLGITAIPTVVFFKNGQEVSRIVGAHPLGRYTAEIAARFGV